jgi:uncharacterized phage infection (PIP) family protein YhgE
VTATPDQEEAVTRTAARPLSAVHTWLIPIILIVGLAAALPAVYLAGTANPQGNLSDLPIALVVEDQSGGVATPSAAASVAAGVEGGVSDAIDLSRMTTGELATAIDEDGVAGAVLIPADFDASIASLLPGAATSEVPTVSILTNAGDGGLSTGLVIANLTPVLTAVAGQLGTELTAAANNAVLPAANAALLAEPFRVVSHPYTPLPNHSGQGTSAFYYALILVLIAFIGASLVGPLVDSALGFIPSEFGPLVTRERYSAISRRSTFIGKVAILIAASPCAAFVLQLVAAAFEVTAPNAAMLWLYSTAVIAAIGTSAVAVFAILGPGIGSLLNTLFFIAVAMVSSGGIVPLEATPGFFRWVASFAPFRHVIDGTRALFYFDGSLAAGLGSAWVNVAVGGAIGLALGLGVTTLYGRVPAFSRHPRDNNEVTG